VFNIYSITITVNNGYYDLVMECSKAPQTISAALSALDPLGTFVQVGFSGIINVPLNILLAKEINLKGIHRLHSEFEQADSMMNSGDIDVSPIITEPFHLEQVIAVFSAAKIAITLSKFSFDCHQQLKKLVGNIGNFPPLYAWHR